MRALRRRKRYKIQLELPLHFAEKIGVDKKPNMNVRLSWIVAMAFLFLKLSHANAMAGEQVKFAPATGVFARVTVEGPLVTYEVGKPLGPNKGAVTVETEKVLHIAVADYNFDGYKDFSVSYVDSGMGNYTLFRIFAFDDTVKRFFEISPQCGDEFLNVVLSTKRRTLTTSNFVGNEMKSCVKKYQ